MYAYDCVCVCVFERRIYNIFMCYECYERNTGIRIQYKYYRIVLSYFLLDLNNGKKIAFVFI